MNSMGLSAEVVEAITSVKCLEMSCAATATGDEWREAGCKCPACGLETVEFWLGDEPEEGDGA